MQLLPDQIELIDAAKDKIRSGVKSLLIQGATGSGKTVISSSIVRGAYDKGKNVVFTVPRRDLIRQTSKTFHEFGIDHSYIAAGLPCHESHNIFIASTQTLKNNLKFKPDLAIVDEAHFGSGTLDEIIQKYKEYGTVILGLSATPWKMSGQGLGCWYDDMVCGKSVKWLIDNNRLSKYRAFAPDKPDLSGISITAGDYAKGQLADKMEKDGVLIGNAVEHYKKHALGKLNIVYCVSIDHSKITAKAFNDAGIPAAHIDGDTPDDERVRIIRAFARRELLVLTNCEILTFGFDLSSASGMNVTVECMSDLRPTKSLALQCQKWGRVLRMKHEPAIIFDHAGNIDEHGLPDADREWTLESRKVIKRASSDRNITVMQCAHCAYCARPFFTCPNCGVQREIISRKVEQVEGELKEVTERKAKAAARMEVGRAKTIDDLKRIASERGYDSKWVYIQSKIKGIGR